MGWLNCPALRCSPHPGLGPPSSPAAPPPTPGLPTCTGPVLQKFCSNLLAGGQHPWDPPPNLQAARRPESQDRQVRECERPQSHRRGLASRGRRQRTLGPPKAPGLNLPGLLCLAQAGSRGCGARSLSLHFRRWAPPQDCRGWAGSIIPPGTACPPSPLPPPWGTEGRKEEGVSRTRGSSSGLPLPTRPLTHTHKVTRTHGSHTSGPCSITSPGSGPGAVGGEVGSREAGK